MLLFEKGVNVDAERADSLAQATPYVDELSSLSKDYYSDATVRPYESFGRRSMRRILKVGLALGVTASLSSGAIAAGHYNELNDTDEKLENVIDRSGMGEVDELLDEVDYKSPIEVAKAALKFTLDDKYEGSLTRFKNGIEDLSQDTAEEAQGLGSSLINTAKGLGLAVTSGLGLFIIGRKRRKAQIALKSDDNSYFGNSHIERINPTRRSYISRTSEDDTSPVLEICDRRNIDPIGVRFFGSYVKWFAAASIASYALSAAESNNITSESLRHADAAIAFATPDKGTRDILGIGSKLRDDFQDNILDDVSETVVNKLPNTTRLLKLEEGDIHELIDSAIDLAAASREEPAALPTFDFFTTSYEATIQAADKTQLLSSWQDKTKNQKTLSIYATITALIGSLAFSAISHKRFGRKALVSQAFYDKNIGSPLEHFK